MNPEPVNEEVTFEDAGVSTKPIIKTDLKGTITFVNSSFCKLSGYSKKEIIGKPYNMIKHPDMPKAIFKKMWKTLEKGEKFRGFIKNIRKDGKYYWVELFIEPIYDDNGVKTGYISVRTSVAKSDKEKYDKLYKEMKEKEV